MMLLTVIAMSSILMAAAAVPLLQPQPARAKARKGKTEQ
jgi:hypothetical protein